MPNLKEIDEALKFAVETKKNTRDSQKHKINEFIDDLLDDRNLITTGVKHDNSDCISA